jgi:hypothetical protein
VELTERLDVRPRDDENVTWEEGAHIEKSDARFRLRDALCRHLPADDLAEGAHFER